MWLGGNVKGCRISEFNSCSAALQVIWMNYSAFNMQWVGMLLALNWPRLQCHVVYHFIIQICYRAHWLKAICILQILLRALHRSWSPEYFVPLLARHFYILYSRYSPLFSQSMLSLSQTWLARICTVLCTCTAVHVITIPEGLFMLCAQDVLVHKMCGFTCFIFGFSYYRTVRLKLYHFLKIKLLITCLLTFSTENPYHYRSFGCVPTYRD